jgi:hypothetical protein
MTNKQSAIFSKMLDTNWTVKELMELGKWNEAIIVAKEHHDLVSKLKKSMGESKYNEFIDNGRKMFSPL